MNAESQDGPSHVPLHTLYECPCGLLSVTDSSCRKNLTCMFFGFRVIFPPWDWHKMAYEQRCSWAGFPHPHLPIIVCTCQARARWVFRCRSATREHSCTTAHGAVVGCIRHRFPGCFGVWYQCFRLQQTHFLFTSLQISFVMANINKLWGSEKPCTAKAAWGFLLVQSSPGSGAYKCHCLFFVYNMTPLASSHLKDYTSNTTLKRQQ